MAPTSFIALLLGLMAAAYAVFGIIAYVRTRGRRVIICPETNQPAGVTVDAVHAAMTAVWDNADVRLASCSRWPERGGCDQACTAQIACGREDTLIETIMKTWYAGKACAVCRRPIPLLRPMDPRPALYNVAAREIIEWKDIPAEAVPAALETHLPVCSNCAVAETFRSRFPELAVDREPTDKRDISVH
jgi:hypothetical protein